MIRSANRQGSVILVSQDLKFAFPFSYAYLIGYLLERNERVELLLRPEHAQAFAEFARHLIAKKPLLVGFGNLYPELYDIRAIIAELDKQGRDFPIIIGGQMVTPTPEFALKITKADIGVLDEGEIILYDIVTALREGEDPAGIKGTAVRDGLDIVNNGPGPFIKDLRQLPKVPYHLFPSEKWVPFGRYYLQAPQPHWRYSDRCISIHGGRGCPFRCNFCYHHGRTRYREIGDMIEEVEPLLSRYNGNMLVFTDDLTIATPKRAAQLVEHVAKLKHKVSYRISCRFDILDRMEDDLLKDIKRTGGRIIAIGIESGSQRILDIMNKHIKLEQIDRGLSRLKRAKLLPTGNVMIGQVGETEEDIDLTKKFVMEKVRENKNLQVSFTLATPFPGSELYDIAKQRGLIKDDYDFYQRFDRHGQMGALSVNMSAMDDRILLEKYRDINQSYLKLRGEVVGPAVFRIEESIKKLHHWNQRNRERLTSTGPAPAIKRRVYDFCYDTVQNSLDTVRLRLRGVEE